MSADLSQTPSDVLERAKARLETLQDNIIRNHVREMMEQVLSPLAAINAELQRRQKDETQ